MPNRPTREFWKKVYPKVYKGIKDKRLKKSTREKTARAITAGIWHNKLKPATKRKFERLRRKREG